MAELIRMASFGVVPGGMAELVRTYRARCAPRVRAEPGNVECYLLEPVADGEPAIACTVWASEDAARAYEGSGRAAAIAGEVRHLFAGPPTLRTYRR